MQMVRRRSCGAKAPIDDEAAHIWSVVIYGREWGATGPFGRARAAAARASLRSPAH